MKKNKIFILLFTLFSVFIFTERVNATVYYTVDNVDYPVNTLEDFNAYYYYMIFVPEGNNDNNFLTVSFQHTNGAYTYFFITRVLSFNTYRVWWEGGCLKSNKTLLIYRLTKGSQYNSTTTLETKSICVNTNYDYTFLGTTNVYSDNTFSIPLFTPNITLNDIKSLHLPATHDIKYYLNNELYQTYTVNDGSSHTLIDNPTYNNSTQYWSGWTYDNNIDLSNITSDINIYGTISDKPIYQVKYYINNELYHTDNVIEGDSYSLIDYSDYNSYTHTFSGWIYDNNIDLSDVRQNIDVTSTLIEKEKTPVYIDFPITREDFYSLMVLIGVLILTQIFRVVYSTKGGKDL